MSKAFTWLPTIYDTCDLTAVVVSYLYFVFMLAIYVNTNTSVGCLLVCVIFEQPPGSWYPRALSQLAWRKVRFTPSGVMKAACDHTYNLKQIICFFVCLFQEPPLYWSLLLLFSLPAHSNSDRNCFLFMLRFCQAFSHVLPRFCLGFAQILLWFCQGFALILSRLPGKRN